MRPLALGWMLCALGPAACGARSGLDTMATGGAATSTVSPCRGRSTSTHSAQALIVKDTGQGWCDDPGKNPPEGLVLYLSNTPITCADPLFPGDPQLWCNAPPGPGDTGWLFAGWELCLSLQPGLPLTHILTSSYPYPSRYVKGPLAGDGGTCEQGAVSGAVFDFTCVTAEAVTFGITWGSDVLTSGTYVAERCP